MSGRPSQRSPKTGSPVIASQARLLAMTSRGRESTNLGGDFALTITSKIMMLITILLMIEDRCSTIVLQKCLLCTYIVYYM